MPTGAAASQARDRACVVSWNAWFSRKGGRGDAWMRRAMRRWEICDLTGSGRPAQWGAGRRPVAPGLRCKRTRTGGRLRLSNAGCVRSGMCVGGAFQRGSNRLCVATGTVPRVRKPLEGKRDARRIGLRPCGRPHGPSTKRSSRPGSGNWCRARGVKRQGIAVGRQSPKPS